MAEQEIQPADHALVAAFCEAAGLATVPDGLSTALGALIATARASRPAIVALPIEFARAAGHSMVDMPDPVEGLSRLHAGDLWLATACSAGKHPALTEMDRLLRALGPTLARMGATDDLVAELLQEVRTRLLVETADRPAQIRGYRGRSDLRNWLRVTAVRDTVRALRRVRATEQHHEVELLMDPSSDPELAALREAYREAFRIAFMTALATLPIRDRNVLRYHLLEQLTIDDIGAIYRVHRATAARWLVRIREQIFEATRGEIMQRLALSPAELDSALRLIRSRLELSVARGLQGANEKELE